jgi:hypothetical protein
MKRHIAAKLAAATATAALAFGAAACEMEEGDPGLDDPMMDDGAGEGEDF